MEVRLLGSGGWLPTDRRETSCVYLREGADVLLLDAGTGLRRLVTEPSLLRGVERLSIALSHFHLDHTAGLVGLPALLHVPERRVFAPGRVLAGADGPDLVHRLLGPPFLMGQSEDVGRLLTGIADLNGGFASGPFTVETRHQPLHPGTSLGFKVNGWLAYCTDTAYDEGTTEFVRGSRVLLHEAMHPGDETEDTTHSAAGEAARVAADAGVERLVLTHVNPELSSEQELEASARARFDASEVGRDGLVL